MFHKTTDRTVLRRCSQTAPSNLVLDYLHASLCWRVVASRSLSKGLVTADQSAFPTFLSDAISHLSLIESGQSIAAAVSILRQAERIGILVSEAPGILADYAPRLFSRNRYLSYVLGKTGIALALMLRGEIKPAKL